METILKDPLLADVNKPLFIEGIQQKLSTDQPGPVYCDIDGVLADFRSKALKINEKIFEIEQQELKETGKCIKFWELINEKGPDFWAYLQPLFPVHNLATIIEMAHPDTKIKLLTARPHYAGQDPTVFKNFEKGRTDWVKWNLNHILPDPETHLIMCERAEKQNYAPGCILIDDYGKNCKEWRQAGGIAIQVTQGPQPLSRTVLHALNLLNQTKTKLISKNKPENLATSRNTTRPQGATS